jgi:hypothetical protein
MALAAAGCGSSSSPPPSHPTAGARGAGSAASGSARDGANAGQRRNPPGSKPKPAGAAPKPASMQGSTTQSGGETNANGAPLGSNTSRAGDNSIQTYGSGAHRAQRAAIVAAMRGFDLALAARDYAEICSGLAVRIGATLASSGRNCPETVKALVVTPPSLARRSATGDVTQVRVGGDNAFVLFRPAGGGQLSYFAMEQEDGKWKSLALTAGTPVDPTAGLDE